MTPLRILFLDSEKTWRGGQDQILSLIVGMKEKGHQVFLASPPGSPLTLRAQRLSLSVFPLKRNSEVSFGLLVGVIRLLKRLNPQIVHFNTPRDLLMGGLAAHWRGNILRVCSRRVDFPLPNRLSSVKFRLAAHHVIAISRSIRKTLLDCGLSGDRVSVIYEGVDLQGLEALPESSCAIPPDRLVVGTVAALTEEKGHAVLLNAMEKLKQRFPGTCFVWVGGGRMRSELERVSRRMGFEEDLLMTGFREDAEALMRKFDIFCLPSLSEGLSSAILTAMAYGKPVVASRVGGIPELVVHGRTGLLVEPGDPAALAGALSRLLASRQLRHEMGQAGRARVESSFTLKKKLDETEELYIQLLRASGIV